MTESVAETPEAPESSVVPVRVAPATAAVWASMLDLVPDAGQDGINNILAQLMEADHVSQLDEPWRVGGLGELANRPIIIQGISKMPAEFDGPLPFFLVVKGALADTGEQFTATTGAVSVVAQLVRAHAIEALPWPCVLRIADRPSASGFFPQHLEGRRG